MAGLQFWKKKCFWIRFERVQRGFLSEKKGKVIPCRWTENRKGDSGGVVNSLDFCPPSLKSLGCFYFRCVLARAEAAASGQGEQNILRKSETVSLFCRLGGGL